MGIVDEFTDEEPKMEQLYGRNSYAAQMKNNNGYEIDVTINLDNNWGFISIRLED